MIVGKGVMVIGARRGSTWAAGAVVVVAEAGPAEEGSLVVAAGLAEVARVADGSYENEAFSRKGG